MAALFKKAHKAGLVMAGCIAIAICSSCADDSEICYDNRSTIGFEISATGGNMVQSRTVQQTEEPSVLLYAHNKDSLFLHTTIEDNPSPAAESAETRGVPITKDNFKEKCQAFGVKAYVNGSTGYMDAKVSTESDGIWTPDGSPRFWPGTETLDFYAFAPYDNGNALANTAYANGTISFSYTVPSTADGKDGEAQPDLLFAFASKSVKNVKDGCVPLNFKHALAAVRFKAHETAKGTIKSIRIKNVYGSGNCTYEGNGGTFKWTQTGERCSFTQSFDIAVDGDNHDVTAKNPEKTFMMVPQSLASAAIEVDFMTDDGKTHTLEAQLSKEWEAGKIYTYTISTESINWTYVFEVTPELKLPLGVTSGDYNVKSYRYRPAYPDKIEAVKWNAVRANDTYKDNIKEFIYKGNGVASGNAQETYTCSFDVLSMKTTYEGDNTLRNASVKGSPESPYDLSTEGGTKLQTTANCYIVNAAGTYSLPLVYGNAIKDGKENVSAYSGFKDYKNANISTPYINGTHDCTLVWSDAFYLFKEVKLKDGKLVFTLNKDYMQQANAIVAVRDREGKIMWSWHIWVTEHDLSKTVGLQDYETGETNKYKLMPYNLGWIDGKSITYEERDIPFNFTQDGSGDVKQLKVVQEGAVLDYKDGGSTYYQWGRKDPIIALKNRGKTGSDGYRPHETWQDGYRYKYEVKKVSLGESIQTPNVYYISNDGNDSHNWLDKVQFNLWDSDYGYEESQISTKTVYDPSPRGFKVPVPRAFAVFVNGSYGSSGGSLNGDIIDDHTYRVYPQREKKGTELILTATGQRVDRMSGLGAPGGLWAMDGVYYWSCCGTMTYATMTSVAYIGFSLCLRQVAKTYTCSFAGAQTMARPVRCIEE